MTCAHLCASLRTPSGDRNGDRTRPRPDLSDPLLVVQPGGGAWSRTLSPSAQRHGPGHCRGGLIAGSSTPRTRRRRLFLLFGDEGAGADGAGDVPLFTVLVDLHDGRGEVWIVRAVSAPSWAVRVHNDTDTRRTGCGSSVRRGPSASSVVVDASSTTL